ncbi:hypothetical protein CSC70_09295 [Pseudoxanthomonas kalamensis DSM 18571]|nr:hypothetical protein CSC70_09295 [Pseudoxanthomonas kalamensis DSM 18571]
MCLAVAALFQAKVADAQTRQTSEPAATTAAGIEPDEIDVRQAQKNATPVPARVTTAKPARAATPVASPKPATANLLAVGAGGDGSQKYETAECGTKDKPITCCTKGDGPGASCKLFMLLCNEGGGTGKGDGDDAICVH